LIDALAAGDDQALAELDAERRRLVGRLVRETGGGEA
jgi:hypothetical protein